MASATDSAETPPDVDTGSHDSRRHRLDQLALIVELPGFVVGSLVLPRWAICLTAAAVAGTAAVALRRLRWLSVAAAIALLALTGVLAYKAHSASIVAEHRSDALAARLNEQYAELNRELQALLNAQAGGTHSSIDQAEQRVRDAMLGYLNLVRAERGLLPLVLESQLNQYAEGHAAYEASTGTLRGLNVSSLPDSSGGTFSPAHAYSLLGSVTIDSGALITLVDGNSELHAALLSPSITSVGIGYSTAKSGMRALVVILARRVHAHTVARGL